MEVEEERSFVHLTLNKINRIYRYWWWLIGTKMEINVVMIMIKVMEDSKVAHQAQSRNWVQSKH